MLQSNGTQISLRNVTKTFPDGTLALKPTDLTIEPGEILVLLGPSGCGKTTTLRLIAGLEIADLDGGEILFGNKNVTNLTIEKRKVGMVFQSYALFPNMNVSENITYGLKVKGTTNAKMHQKLNEMLEMFDLHRYKDRDIHQLSGGQRQRVALARAIITEPDVLLLDEPLSALDALLKQRLRMDIHSLLKSLGITAVYVTHDQEEAMAMGDRIAVLDHGEIAQIGTAEEIYLNPANSFVADFIGRMNRLDGEVQDGTLVLDSGKSFPFNSLAKENNDFVSVMLRPEDIKIAHFSRDSKVASDSNSQLSGIIEEKVFLGDRTRLLVSGITQTGQLTVDCFERAEYYLGQTINLTFNPERLIPLSD